MARESEICLQSSKLKHHGDALGYTNLTRRKCKSRSVMKIFCDSANSSANTEMSECECKVKKHSQLSATGKSPCNAIKIPLSRSRGQTCFVRCRVTLALHSSFALYVTEPYFLLKSILRWILQCFSSSDYFYFPCQRLLCRSEPKKNHFKAKRKSSCTDTYYHPSCPSTAPKRWACAMER